MGDFIPIVIVMSKLENMINKALEELKKDSRVVSVNMDSSLFGLPFGIVEVDRDGNAKCVDND